ncbi:ester cyclase, partial [Dolichospermum circinale CS-545/17]|nr:ester cyclase [Dolichospermum circinale CS-545/17]
MTNKEVVRLFFEIYNSQDYEATYKYIAPNYIDHGLPQVRRVDDAIEILKTTHKAFPDIKVVIDDLIEENDKVVFRGHFT